ncbi:MAG: pantetheine-phosphate adenylyltransferase [Paramuribaculum sp.]|nr:pantetheine-phosphate adenylyltransferase [Paramuribaculum sp.]
MIPKSPEAVTTAIFPGSFDPFTLGHLDIVERALRIFGRVVIAVGINSAKQSDASVAQRIDDIRKAVAPLPGAEVMSYSGLTVDAARECGAVAIVRGIRSVADFEYERNLADLNRRIAGIDTVMLAADPSLAAVSSSAVRELKRYGYDVSEFLP